MLSCHQAEYAGEMMNKHECERWSDKYCTIAFENENLGSVTPCNFCGKCSHECFLSVSDSVNQSEQCRFTRYTEAYLNSVECNHDQTDRSIE